MSKPGQRQDASADLPLTGWPRCAICDSTEELQEQYGAPSRWYCCKACIDAYYSGQKGRPEPVFGQQKLIETEKRRRK